MGWNSWDSYGTTVTEDEVLANARFLHDHLLDAGWDTIVVDIAWFDPFAHAHGYNDPLRPSMDAWGRLLPAPNRFPSSAGGKGFAPLADAVHALSLKFGVHVMRGIPRAAVEQDLPVFGTEFTARQIANTGDTCVWNHDNYGLDHEHPGAQAFYDGFVAQLASWGVDFIKADDMLSPYHDAEIEAYARAIERCGRPIVLSLSPGTHLSTRHVEHLRQNAQMWRISDDLWDRWDDVHAQFARLARWAPFQRSGRWADADMLPLGRIGIRAERGEPRDSRLTDDEQQTLLTLWVMGRSPLMVGGDLPSSDPRTIELLANPWLARVLADARDSAEIIREPQDDGEFIVWTARSAQTPSHYVALFWTGADAVTRAVPLSAITGDPSPSNRWSVRELSAGGNSAHEDAQLTSGEVRADIPSHGVRWFAVTPA
ncbi:glycoside hydrolase family 27 protein [Planctomonas sp. JC2975]|nr:glycoside hydrolase family 27 protein [Planctomonas sp. JC2975]